MEEKKKIEVITGDGSDLNISPVYEHLNVAKPKSSKEKTTHVIVPKETKKTSKKEEN